MLSTRVSKSAVGVSVGTLSVVEHHVKIANNVRIHTQVFVPEFSVLEEGCWLGPNVVLTNAPQRVFKLDEGRGAISATKQNPGTSQ